MPPAPGPGPDPSPDDVPPAGPPLLVAHRGDPDRFPENTLPGLRGALEAGARALEFDVQLTADGVPVLYHDPTLARTSGRPGCLLDLTADEASQLPAGEPARFGERFASVRVPTLEEAVTELAGWPSVLVLVEVKDESTARHGAGRCLRAVAPALARLGSRAVLISYDADLLRLATAGDSPWPEPPAPERRRVGWVLSRYNPEARRQAAALAPDYLIVNHRRVPAGEGPPWPGPWQWVAYDSVDPAEVRALAARGFPLVETKAFGTLIARLRG